MDQLLSSLKVFQISWVLLVLSFVITQIDMHTPHRVHTRTSILTHRQREKYMASPMVSLWDSLQSQALSPNCAKPQGFPSVLSFGDLRSQRSNILHGHKIITVDTTK